MEQIRKYSIENLIASSKLNNQFDLFRFEYFVEDIEHLKSTHRHEFYTFIFVTEGYGNHTIDFEQFEIVPNRIFFINQGQVHKWNYVENVKGYVILFNDDFYNIAFTGNEAIKSDMLLSKLKTYSDIIVSDVSAWNNLLLLIENEHSNQRATSNNIICLLIKVIALKYLNLCQDIQTVQPVKNRKQELVNSFMGLINKHYLKHKLPSDYAPMLNITANYLNAICREILDESASFLIKKRVILEAKRLITHTAMTISEISFFLNFEDKSHFGKYFKKSAGFTPETFRNSYLAHLKH